MAVTDTQRTDLHTHFQETMGHERAAVMMDLLPPVGWGDVATKQDLALIRKDLDHAVAPLATRDDLHLLEKQFAKLETRMLERMNAHLVALVGVNTTLFGIAVGVVTLLR